MYPKIQQSTKVIYPKYIKTYAHKTTCMRTFTATENNSTVYRKMNKQTVTYSCSEIPPTNRKEWDY